MLLLPLYKTLESIAIYTLHILGQIRLKPRYGSELGGTPVVVSGTNLTVAEDDNVTCIFNDKETEGFVINEEEVLCISPEMTITGRVPFEVHIAGQNLSFTGISIYISCELNF